MYLRVMNPLREFITGGNRHLKAKLEEVRLSGVAGVIGHSQLRGGRRVPSGLSISVPGSGRDSCEATRRSGKQNKTYNFARYKMRFRLWRHIITPCRKFALAANMFVTV